MFVDKYYDNSLWHIVNADKSHRKEIVEFIKSIPEDLIMDIRQSIIEYRKKTQCVFYDMTIFENYKILGQEIYSYYITFSGDLVLKKSIKKGIFYDDIIELSLCELKNSEDFNLLEDEYLGYLKTNIACEYRSEKLYLTSDDESEYFVVKLPVGFLYFYCEKLCDKRNFRVRFSHFKSVPKDLSVYDLEELVNDKKLVLNL